MNRLIVVVAVMTALISCQGKRGEVSNKDIDHEGYEALVIRLAEVNLHPVDGKYTMAVKRMDSVDLYYSFKTVDESMSMDDNYKPDTIAVLAHVHRSIDGQTAGKYHVIGMEYDNVSLKRRQASMKRSR